MIHQMEQRFIYVAHPKTGTGNMYHLNHPVLQCSQYVFNNSFSILLHSRFTAFPFYLRLSILHNLLLLFSLPDTLWRMHCKVTQHMYCSFFFHDMLCPSFSLQQCLVVKLHVPTTCVFVSR